MSNNPMPSKVAAGYHPSAHGGDLILDITQYAPMVKKIAGILISRLPASIELDDLIQVGIIGLIDAARQFDPGQGVQFETFASQRVRGAMLDELRREDWMPRQTRRHAKQIEEAVSVLEQRLGRSPLESEIAEEMSLSLADYQELLGECKGLSLLHYEDFTDEDGDALGAISTLVDSSSPDPLATLSDVNFRQSLIEAITLLPERDQLLMALYYEQELNLKEIGAVLGVSESRVSQLHSQAIVRLRSKLKDWI
ncbi:MULTISPECIES: RNA polymerase sigma factor FliA [unclassified Paludibacterium]|uniref:RNA polymerase sigma factor FliA n=1 Tax=unclassified Paludibacterium TaxID=2618429 RepID=UPI002111D07B|nr:RNA polymerase sigma factor FliA [Paludibacterium sp. B53371]BEV73652.1 RNA polymerase sigma factor FliA [Paludibacterium sp. THUN1379]